MDSLFTFRTPTGADPASTDTFATLVFEGIPGLAPKPGNQEQINAPTSGPISGNWKNTGANSIDTRVLGTNDKDAADADCDIVVTAAAIANGGLRHISINPALYAYYRFQHKATAGGSQGASKLVCCQHRV